MLKTGLTIAMLLTAFNARPIEIETTHREGDEVPVVILCQSVEDAERLALLFSDSLGDLNIIIRCVMAKKAPFGLARIGQWESGPYYDGTGSFSVWEITRNGISAWTLLGDGSGRHSPVKPI
jgi:hypothetical protein